jgi:hypothetical protein
MFRQLFLLSLIFLFGACASVSVKTTKDLAQNREIHLPDKILVRPFEFWEPGLRVDRSGESLERFKYDLQEEFTRDLVERLTKHVAPAKAIAATAPLPRGNYWLVTGRFDRVYQGSRLLRSSIGFGFGATKFETSVVIYDLSRSSRKPVLLIETTGGSNAAAGAIPSLAYFFNGVTSLGSVFNLLEGVRSGVSYDRVRTSRGVTSATAEHLYIKGLTENDNLKPKRLGRLQYPWWPFNPREPQKVSETVTPAENTDR